MSQLSGTDPQVFSCGMTEAFWHPDRGPPNIGDISRKVSRLHGPGGYAVELSQHWGSGSDCRWRVRVVGWVELLSEAGTERAIIDGAPNLQQQV